MGSLPEVRDSEHTTRKEEKINRRISIAGGERWVSQARRRGEKYFFFG